MYFFLKPKYGSGDALNEHFQFQSYLKLPSACKITQLNIQTASIGAIMGQPFQIFHDDVQAQDDQKPVEEDSTEIYELDIIVRGFKEKFVKGKVSSWIK